MKKTCLLFSLVFIFLFQTNAQKLKVGVKAGVSIPKLRASGSDDSFSGGYRSVASFQAGVVTEYKFNNLLSLQAELNYSPQGGIKKGQQKIRTKSFASFIPPGLSLPDYLFANFDGEVSLTYLELPIMAKFSIRTSSAAVVSVYGGPYVGYLIKAEGKSTGKSKIYVDAAQTTELTFTVGGNAIPVGVQDLTRNEDIIDQCNRVNYGFQGGASYLYELSKKIDLFAAAGGTYGFRFVQEDPNLGENKTGGATISIGAFIKW